MTKFDYAARLRASREKLEMVQAEAIKKAGDIQEWIERAREAKTPEQLAIQLDNAVDDCVSLKGYVEEL